MSPLIKRSDGLQMRKKRFKLEDESELILPLQSKSTNVASTNTVKACLKKKVSTPPKKRRCTKPQGALFADENVTLRLVDTDDKRFPLHNTDSVSDEARRLKRKTEDEQPYKLETIHEQESIKLSDFDQPPDSTSTPIASPDRSSSPSMLLLDTMRPSPVINMNAGVNWYPPIPPSGHAQLSVCGNPLLPPYYHYQESPLRNRNIRPEVYQEAAYTNFPNMPYYQGYTYAPIMSHPYQEVPLRSYPNPYGAFYAQNPVPNPDNVQPLGSHKSSTTSSGTLSYKSSGGNATYHGSSG